MTTVDPVTLVFLDETSTQTVMTRRRGRAPRGNASFGPFPATTGRT